LDRLRIHGAEVAVWDDEYGGCIWIELHRPCTWQKVQGPAILVVGLYIGLNIIQQG
jgi:hypothetical protein